MGSLYALEVYRYKIRRDFSNFRVGHQTSVKWTLDAESKKRQSNFISLKLRAIFMWILDFQNVVTLCVLSLRNNYQYLHLHKTQGGGGGDGDASREDGGGGGSDIGSLISLIGPVSSSLSGVSPMARLGWLAVCC